ncbi:hypothetical protein KP509_04G087800 [Ceratopteris richardii]|uniref:2-C-methyl-D-erythritol 4-phosphate cytidylyltransferase, chloroplastic n=2 Tax=Ceratopteris richardii TaxID=49495 RepID=A0A8T2UUX1_CERRI|nr:hypothetical protein KP509_04G087800 [Ceratopteris richardii]KAH7440015.1 hypothetical protein KP509_04G087800 [Ceratopteris richardii]KAH7440016.1 hypothetical protein KP509_04G087800 [Ceratopteris richardii]KAH7440017.1 hypothetical protein KP509_04G087800 [Ceratopteris richardii]KAH7440018.1 hypothetical protein KP509_04G087800 [Ceratopteris richardii]
MECACSWTSPASRISPSVLQRHDSPRLPSHLFSSLSFRSSCHFYPSLSTRCSSRSPACTYTHASIPAETNNLKSTHRAAPPHSVSVILLAGGTGKRMGANMPKQYLPLHGRPIALHSFDTFSSLKEVLEIVVVCDPSYRDIFEEAGKDARIELKFALPGRERQFSVQNGLKEISGSAKLVCVHDSARPLILVRDILKVISDAYVHGAAVLGVPVKGTIKEAKKDGFVMRTLDRSLLWEMQTPQVIEPSLLQKGFELVEKQNLEVTDDVSIVEHLKHPVFITEGSYTNIKVTTPDDMIVAERILQQIPKENLETITVKTP